jgi:predicted GTPase
MKDVPLALKAFLVDAAGRLRDARLPERLADGMGRLSAEVEQPCVVAAVGRMKAGKSTSVNALLGDDVARVGAAETTATRREGHG